MKEFVIFTSMLGVLGLVGLVLIVILSQLAPSSCNDLTHLHASIDGVIRMCETRDDCQVGMDYYLERETLRLDMEKTCE